MTTARRTPVDDLVDAPPAGPTTGERRRDDRGEGVISTAIAVLVMAFLGTLMWIGFRTTFTHAQSKTDTQVEQIGQP